MIRIIKQIIVLPDRLQEFEEMFPVTHPGRLGAWYTGLGTQTLAPKKKLENVLQRNLRIGAARECIFRASGGTRFKGEGMGNSKM